MEAVTGETGVTVFWLIVVVLAAAFSSSLVAVRIEAFADITVARAAHGAAPPTPRTWFFHFVLTVLSIVVLTALACVTVRGARLTNTRGQMLTGIQTTCINTVFAEETRVTDAGVCIPVVCALAVVRADVGVAGVGHITAFFHVDL